jgi:hypothetical protein
MSGIIISPRVFDHPFNSVPVPIVNDLAGDVLDVADDVMALVTRCPFYQRTVSSERPQAVWQMVPTFTLASAVKLLARRQGDAGWFQNLSNEIDFIWP